MSPLNRALTEASLLRSVAASAASVPEPELRQGMQDVLGQRPEAYGKPDGIWVFAYGALLWDDGVECDADLAGTVQGLVRRYAVWDDRNRGTPERRSLTLGLDRDSGMCAGAALHIAEGKVPEALWSVWKQEMSGGCYTAEWVDVDTASGVVRAVTFIADPGHPLYAGALPDDEVVSLLAAGVGPGGTAAAYLLNTVNALRDRGASDLYLERLEMKLARQLGR